MTAPVRPSLDQIVAQTDRPPLDAIVGAADKGGDQLAQLHADFKSGKLQRDIASKNEMDQAQVPDYGTQVAGGIASLAKDIPGGEALQAGARSVVRGQPYRQALSDIQGAEEDAPKAVRVGNRIAGATIGQLATPGSPAMSAGRFGTLSGLLQSDPDANLSDRLQSGAARGLTGLALGKAFDLGATALKSAAAPKLDAALNTLAKERSDASTPAYDAFRKLGDLGDTPALTKISELPIVRSALNTVKGQSPTLAELPDTHAEVLDAAYKVVGNKAWRAANGFTQSEARDALGNAIEEAAKAKGGSYRAALDAFSEPSAQMNAMQRGAAALQNAVKPGGASSSRALTTSVPAFERWSAANPELQQSAQQGVLSQLKGMPMTARIPLPLLRRVPLPIPGDALRAASDLAQPAIGDVGQSLRAALTSRSSNLP